MGPRTNTLSGRGRKSASRRSQTRASEAASVTPAPLGILTATPRKSARRITSQEEQDAVRRLIEEPCGDSSKPCSGEHHHQRASRKANDKASSSSNSPVRYIRPRSLSGSDDDDLMMSGALPIADDATDQQEHRSRSTTGAQRPGRRPIHRSAREDAPTPSSLESTGETRANLRGPTPFPRSSRRGPSAGASNSIRRGAAPQASSSDDGHVPPTSSTSRIGAGSAGAGSQRPPDPSLPRAGHKHTLSSSSLADTLAIRKKPSLTRTDMETINQNSQETMHAALRDFGAIFGPQLVNTLEARLTQDASRRETAARERHLRTSESLASLRAGSQVGITRLLNTAHHLRQEIRQDFSHFRRKQDHELADMRRAKENAQFMQAEYRQQLLSRLNTGAAERTSGRHDAHAMQNLRRNHADEIARQREDFDQAARLLDGVNSLAERSNAAYEDLRDRTTQEARTRQALSQHHTARLAEQRHELLARLERVERERVEAQQDRDQGLGVSNDRQSTSVSAQQQQTTADTRRSLAQLHGAFTSQRERERDERLLQAQRQRDENRREREQLAGASEDIQRGALDAATWSHEAAGTRRSIAEVHSNYQTEREQERHAHRRDRWRDGDAGQREGEQLAAVAEHIEGEVADASHRAQEATETRLSITEAHATRSNAREQERSSRMLEIQRERHGAQRERDAANDMSERIQAGSAAAEQQNRQAASTRHFLNETQNTGLLGRMTAMVFGRGYPTSDERLHTAERERDQAINQAQQLQSSSDDAIHRGQQGTSTRQALHQVQDAGLSSRAAVSRQYTTHGVDVPNERAQLEMMRDVREFDHRAAAHEREANETRQTLYATDRASHSAQLGQIQDLERRNWEAEMRAQSAETGLANVVSLASTSSSGIPASSAVTRFALHDHETAQIRQQLMQARLPRTTRTTLSSNDEVDHDRTISTSTSLVQSADVAASRNAQAHESRVQLSSRHLANMYSLFNQPSTQISTASEVVSAHTEDVEGMD